MTIPDFFTILTYDAISKPLHGKQKFCKFCNARAMPSDLYEEDELYRKKQALGYIYFIYLLFFMLQADWAQSVT